MFGHQLCLPIDVLFPHDKGHKETPVCSRLHCQVMWMAGKAFKEAQVQSTSEAERQKWYYDRKANAISMEPGNLVLAKAHAYRGGGKWRTGGRRNHMKWNTRLLKVSLPTLWGTSRQDAHQSPTKTDFFSSLLQRGLLSVPSCKLSGSGAPLPP